jgi:hypothetical protein
MGKKKTTNYCSNEELCEIIRRWKDSGEERIPEELANQFILIIDHLLTSGKFRGYSLHWKSEMKGDALLSLVKYAKNFSLEKSSNPFSYFTQICGNCFKHRLLIEKRRLEAYESYKNQQSMNIYDVIPGDSETAYSYVDNDNQNWNYQNLHYTKDTKDPKDPSKKKMKERVPKNSIKDFFE